MSTKVKIHNVKPCRRFLAGRLVFFIILVVGMTGWPAARAHADGIFTHAEVAERAINILDKAAYAELVTLLNNYQGDVKQGAMFPDWGMAVNIFKPGPGIDNSTNYSDLSEGAHDTTAVMNVNRKNAVMDAKNYSFRSRLAGYLLPTFRNLKTEDDKRAIAFLFGLIAHQEADGLWHIEEATRKGYGKSKGQLPDPAVELYADLYVQRSFAPLGDKSSSQKAINKSTLTNEAILFAYGKKKDSSENLVSDIMLTYGRSSQQAHVNLTVEAAAAPPCTGLVVTLLPPLNIIAGLAAKDCDTYIDISSQLENYTPGGLKDGANQVARVWQQTWNWLKTYTPTTQVELSSQPQYFAGVDESWHTRPVTVKLTGINMVNGQINPRLDDIALIDTSPFQPFYNINGSSYIPYTQPLKLDADGIYNISYYTVDNMGNSSSVENLIINIDMTPPIATPTQSPKANDYGWNNSDVTITWNWTDNGTGIDPASCTKSSTSNGEGVHTLTATCKDKAGNTARTSHIVMVDQMCMDYHVVKDWEKTNFIAHNYDLKWKAIAKANKLGIVEYTIAGDRLCIPISKSAIATARSATLAKSFTPAHDSGWISFPLTKLPPGLWRVKVRDADISRGGWIEVDKIDTSVEHGPKYSFQLPSSLSSTPRVNVCLINQKTNDGICKIVFTGT